MQRRDRSPRRLKQNVPLRNNRIARSRRLDRRGLAQGDRPGVNRRYRRRFGRHFRQSNARFYPFRLSGLRSIARNGQRTGILLLQVRHSGLITQHNADFAQIGEKLFPQIVVRDSSMELHQASLAPIHNSIPSIVYPFGRMIKNIQHLCPSRTKCIFFHRQHQPVPIDPHGPNRDQRIGDRDPSSKIVQHRKNSLPAQPHIGRCRSIGRSPSFQSHFHTTPRGVCFGFSQKIFDSLDRPAILPQGWLHHGTSIPEIDRQRVGRLLPPQGSDSCQ